MKDIFYINLAYFNKINAYLIDVNCKYIRVLIIYKLYKMRKKFKKKIMFNLSLWINVLYFVGF